MPIQVLNFSDQFDQQQKCLSMKHFEKGGKGSPVVWQVVVAPVPATKQREEPALAEQFSD